MNRADFHIAITSDGRVYVAQGNPALAALDDLTDEPLADYEGGLYHSQMAHRVAVEHPYIGDPSHRAIMTPTAAASWGGAEVVDCSPNGRRCTGTPLLVGAFR